MSIKIWNEWVSVFFTSCKIKVGGSLFLQFVKKADRYLYYLCYRFLSLR